MREMPISNAELTPLNCRPVLGLVINFLVESSFTVYILNIPLAINLRYRRKHCYNLSLYETKAFV